MTAFCPEPLFYDRADAGRHLAAKLSAYAGHDDVVVLALPRGGVAIGAEVAAALNAALDVLVVRKLGAPDREELAMGAVAGNGITVLNEDVIAALGISRKRLDDALAREQREVDRRERSYRGERPFPDVRAKTVIVVDDGLATGATMLAAVAALRQRAAARIVVAVPVATAGTCDLVRRDADEVVCCFTPEPFGGVGAWYADFSQLSDAQVRQTLAASAQR